MFVPTTSLNIFLGVAVSHSSGWPAMINYGSAGIIATLWWLTARIKLRWELADA